LQWRTLANFLSSILVRLAPSYTREPVRRRTLFLLFLTSLSCSGCGTFINFTGALEHGTSKHLQVYGGVRRDFRIMGDGAGGIVLGLLDLPFCLILDTVTLPITVAKALLVRSPEEPLSPRLVPMGRGESSELVEGALTDLEWRRDGFGRISVAGTHVRIDFHGGEDSTTITCVTNPVSRSMERRFYEALGRRLAK